MAYVKWAVVKYVVPCLECGVITGTLRFLFKISIYLLVHVQSGVSKVW